MIYSVLESYYVAKGCIWQLSALKHLLTIVMQALRNTEFVYCAYFGQLGKKIPCFLSSCKSHFSFAVRFSSLLKPEMFLVLAFFGSKTYFGQKNSA